MGVLERVLQQPGGYQTCGVRHIYHKDSTDLVRHLAYALIIPLAAVG